MDVKSWKDWAWSLLSGAWVFVVGSWLVGIANTALKFSLTNKELFFSGLTVNVALAYGLAVMTGLWVMDYLKK